MADIYIGGHAFRHNVPSRKFNMVVAAAKRRIRYMRCNSAFSDRDLRLYIFFNN